MPEEGGRNFLEQYEEDGTLYSISELYGENFEVGVALGTSVLSGEEETELVCSQFSSITCENEMKPDYILDYQATIAEGGEEYPVVQMSSADALLTFAQENGLKVRGHTLIWHSQTPWWLFTVGYSKDADAEMVSRDVMIKRMENYISQVITYCNENYPGVVYAWDVVNEAVDTSQENNIRLEENYWYQIIGEDYIELAFVYGRKYADSDQKLFLNDYNCYQSDKRDAICEIAASLQEKDLIDGIGMQSHILMGYPSLDDYEAALRAFGSLGLEVQVTELEISQTSNTAAAQKEQAVRYKELFSLLKEIDDAGDVEITAVTFWGLTDDRSWLNSSGANYPLLFNSSLEPKPAFFGAILDDSI